MSSCSIEYEGDYASFYKENYVEKSRKEHICHECYKKIPIGSKYQKIFMIYDGNVYNYKTCMDCVSAISSFGGCEMGRFWETLKESIEDCGAHVCFSNLENLTPIALEKIINIIDEIIEWEDEE